MALRLAGGLTLYIARHGQTEANVEKRVESVVFRVRGSVVERLDT